ncbi:MAG: helix-turn-helix transcriptional regulator [Lachnospiraceae bacterium]|nr:helix-turn-helix transcriptional regulator [Lachnospiraceae bacterium]
MERKGLGGRINTARKDRGLTAEKLSELCNINATYLRQIEGGMKMPSLPVFINICNALRISPDYLLQDALVSNEVTKIRELADLWEKTSPSRQEIAAIMIQAVLEHR